MFHRTRLDGQSSNVQDHSLQNHSWDNAKKSQSSIKEGSALWHASRAVAGLGLVVFGTLASPFIGIAKAGHFLKDQYRIRFQPSSMNASTKRMKKKEESDKLTAMQNVKAKDQAVVDQTKAYGFKESVTSKLEKTKTNIAKREIVKELSKAGTLTPKLLEKIKQSPNLVSLQDGKFQLNPGNDRELEAALKLIDFDQISKGIEARGNLNEGEIGKFQASVERLNKTIENSKGDKPENVNKKMIKELRACLNSPVYQLLKEDEKDPSVKLLHHYASALWNKAPSMDAFMDIGKTIHDKMGPKTEGQESANPPENPPSTGGELALKLRDSRKMVAKEQWTDHGGFNRAMYAITHPRQAMGSMASTGGNLRVIPSLAGAHHYDSHGTLSNNPSLQGVSNYKIQNGETNYSATVNNCYGGSPTIDDDISPEFLAVLQAAENNQFAEKIDEDIPQMINYTNLQNISHKNGEGPRSIAIMKLNDQYPLSFFGMTLTKDSSLYKMPTEEDVVYKDPLQFGSVMKGELLRSFNPNETGHGYHFPGNKEAWEPVFDQVIQSANQYFNNIPNWNEMDPRTLQGAYQEYVYSMLNGVIEMESIKALKDKGIEAPKIMTIKACKENIDRGGMENVKYMYTKLPKDQKDRDSLFLGCMHGRPLSARDRVILEDRMPQVLSFMELIEPEKFQEEMDSLFRNLKYEVTESNFTPALSSS